ncbi:MAG: hypothetical protein ACFFFG_14500 [Candidatus Thorarchaeota archaeon]
MSIVDPTDEKQRKIHDRVRALILQSGDNITKNIRIEIGRISDTRMKQIRVFSGAGGKTYVIEAGLTTSLAGEIDGGIVIKFAHDLDAEVNNAKQLVELLKKRQQDWLEWKKQHEIPKQIKRFSDHVFAPEVIHVIPEAKALILEFLSGYSSLLQVDLPQKSRWEYAGYALARLHGSKRQSTNVQLYSPLIRMLSPKIDQKWLDYWEQVLEQANGGVDFIHGDSHLSNLLISPEGIAWIDAMMLPKLDRMDDIGYIISHAIQEHVVNNIGFGINVSKLVETITRGWVPLVLATYKRTYDISQLYTQLPLDFFLGSHLIIRGEIWEKEIAEILFRVGRHFIYKMPIAKMLHTE